MAETESGPVLGGITDAPVAKENSLVVEELGRYAVEEYNKNTNALLEFSNVVSVKEQVVSGTIYYLTIEAVQGGEKKLYQAKVWVKPWMDFKELQDFKPAEETDQPSAENTEPATTDTATA